jgi:hypothetical protein
MTAADRDPIERFDAALEALGRGEPVPPDSSDPTLLPAVARLRALDRAQRADPRLAERIWTELMNEAGVTGANPLPQVAHITPVSRNGRAAPSPWRSGGGDAIKPVVRRLPLAQLAAAAVLLLTLVASLLVLRIAAPRPTATLDAADAPTVQTLVDTVVDNPAVEWTPLTVERWTFQPGGGALTIPPLTGPQWIVAEGSGLVVAVGGVERELVADAGLVVPPGQELVMWNTGSGASSALRGFAEARFVFEEYDQSVITRQTALDTEAHEALPPGASRVVFERLTLFAGTTLVLEPATGQDWLSVASGELGVTLLGNGLPLNWQSGREREIADDELLPALVPGTKVALHNIGDESLVLLHLRVLPATDGDAGQRP